MEKRVVVICTKKSPYHEYWDFYDKLKEICPDYVHQYEDLWLVRTDLSCTEIVSSLIPFMECGHIEENREVHDGLFVSELGNDKAGFVSVSMWEWIGK